MAKRPGGALGGRPQKKANKGRRPTMGSEVIILKTENTKENFPEGIGDKFNIAVDAKDQVPFQIEGHSVWLYETDVMWVSGPFEEKTAEEELAVDEDAADDLAEEGNREPRAPLTEEEKEELRIRLEEVKVSRSELRQKKRSEMTPEEKQEDNKLQKEMRRIKVKLGERIEGANGSRARQPLERQTFEPEIEAMLDEWVQLKRTGGFEQADEIRDVLRAEGIDPNKARPKEGHAASAGAAAMGGAGFFAGASHAPARFDPAIEAELDQWVEAKRAKNYELSDAIQERLRSRGINPAHARPKHGGKAAMGKGCGKAFSGMELGWLPSTPWEAMAWAEEYCMMTGCIPHQAMELAGRMVAMNEASGGHGGPYGFAGKGKGKGKGGKGAKGAKPRMPRLEGDLENLPKRQKKPRSEMTAEEKAADNRLKKLSKRANRPAQGPDGLA